MITREMIELGYNNGLIRIIDSSSNECDGIAAKIGDYFFYFAGEEGDEYTDANKFKEEIGDVGIKQMLFNTLEDFRLHPEEFEDEYNYYESYLKENSKDVRQKFLREKRMRANRKLKEAREVASKLTNAINIMGINPSDIADALQYEHRALQSDFAFICMNYLRFVASEGYQFDARNEWAHKVAKKFINPEFDFDEI